MKSEPTLEPLRRPWPTTVFGTVSVVFRMLCVMPRTGGCYLAARRLSLLTWRSLWTAPRALIPLSAASCARMWIATETAAGLTLSANGRGRAPLVLATTSTCLYSPRQAGDRNRFKADGVPRQYSLVSLSVLGRHPGVLSSQVLKGLQCIQLVGS